MDTTNHLQTNPSKLPEGFKKRLFLGPDYTEFFAGDTPLCISVDTETTELIWHSDRLYGVSIGRPDGRCAFFPVWRIPEQALAWLRNPKIGKIGQNFRFDRRFLYRWLGLDFSGHRCIDILQLALLIDENQALSLKARSVRDIGADALAEKEAMDKVLQAARDRQKSKPQAKRHKFSHVGHLCAADLRVMDRAFRIYGSRVYDSCTPRYYDVIALYGAEDAYNTMALFYHDWAELYLKDQRVKAYFKRAKGPMDYFMEEVLPSEEAILAMELNGVRVRPEVLDEIGTQFIAKQKEVEDEIYKLFGKPIQEIEDGLFHYVRSQKKSESAKQKVKPATHHVNKNLNTKFSLSKGAHVGKLLYEKMGVPARLTAKSKEYATGDPVLAEIRKEMLTFPKQDVAYWVLKFLDLFAKYRSYATELSHRIGTDAKGLKSHLVQKPNGETWIFPEYPSKTVTGRLSSENPNFQNITRGSPIKRVIVPSSADKVFIYADYSQIELRVAAHLSQDRKMMQDYLENRDIHKETAADAFGCLPADVTKAQRQAGKTLNFLLIYDGGPLRLQQQLEQDGCGDFTLEQCQDFKTRYMDRRAQYKNYLWQQLIFMRRYGVVLSETGRVRRLPDALLINFLDRKFKVFKGPPEIRSKLGSPGMNERQIFELASKRFGHAKKQGYNAPIQGLAASICKRALARLHANGFKLITQVHDAIIVEVDKKEVDDKAKLMRQLLESTYTLSVPLVADIKVLNSFDESDKYTGESND